MRQPGTINIRFAWGCIRCVRCCRRLHAASPIHLAKSSSHEQRPHSRSPRYICCFSTGTRLRYIFCISEKCFMANIMYQSDMATALKMLFHGLRLLGIDLPEDPDEQKREFLEDIKILNDKIGKLPHVSQLANLPDCKDPTQLHIFKLYVLYQPFEPKHN